MGTAPTPKPIPSGSDPLSIGGIDKVPTTPQLSTSAELGHLGESIGARPEIMAQTAEAVGGAIHPEIVGGITTAGIAIVGIFGTLWGLDIMTGGMISGKEPKIPFYNA